MLGIHPLNGAKALSGNKLISDGLVDNLMETKIDEFYRDLSCPMIPDLMREIERRCSAARLTPPNRKVVAPRVRDRNQREV
jgi:DNA polymerase III delta prime subunit